jgi:hypothetical protein
LLDSEEKWGNWIFPDSMRRSPDTLLADSEKIRPLFFYINPLRTHDFKILQNKNCITKYRNGYAIF